MENIKSSSSLKDKEYEGKTNNNNLDNINNFDISLKNTIYSLNYHYDSIYCLSILNDGRLISGSGDYLIIIYSKTKYQPDLIINEHEGPLFYITQSVQEY